MTRYCEDGQCGGGRGPMPYLEEGLGTVQALGRQLVVAERPQQLAHQDVRLHNSPRPSVLLHGDASRMMDGGGSRLLWRLPQPHVGRHDPHVRPLLRGHCRQRNQNHMPGPPQPHHHLIVRSEPCACSPRFLSVMTALGFFSTAYTRTVLPAVSEARRDARTSGPVAGQPHRERQAASQRRSTGAFSSLIWTAALTHPCPRRRP